MSVTFRKAIREATSTLVGLSGESGSGKTFSALRFARGLVGPHGKLCVIDTEAGRALHYADRFDFDHCDLKPPFSPQAYTDAIVAAEEAGYAAIVIDSMSHEWSGEGGCQDIHDEAARRLATDKQTGQVQEWKIEQMSAPAWRDAKMAHKRMISRLLQCRAHLIFCLRSEEKIKFDKQKYLDKNGKEREKTVIVPMGWQPICEKNFMFEMTCSFMLHSTNPGYGIPIKLQEQHKPFFRADSPIDEAAGELLSKWAAGGTPPKAEPKSEDPIKTRTESLREACAAAKVSYEDILARAEVRSPKEMDDATYNDAMALCRRRIEKASKGGVADG